MASSPGRAEDVRAPAPDAAEDGTRSGVDRVVSLLPRGAGIPGDAWDQRHRVVLWILWLHIPVLVLFGLYGGLDRWISYARYESFGYLQSALEGLVIALFAGAASWKGLNRRLRSSSAALGLITCSAVLTQFSGGFIEAHFHFFAILGLLAWYEDWVPFLLAIGYVLVHHGTVGTIAPGSVYNHPAAIAHPWRWAGIHAFFIASLSSFLVANWTVAEQAREEMQAHARKVERALSLQEATLESTAEGILVVDLDGHVTSYNEPFQTMWGIPDELVEQGDDEALLQHVVEQLENPEEFTEKVQALYAQPEAESVDTIRFKDGRVFERASRPQKLGDRTVGRVWTFRDITDHLRARQALKAKAAELEEAIEMLERSNEDLRQFAYVASHDLQEPMRSVMTHVQLLEKHYGDQLDEEAREYIQFAVDSVKEMRHRVQDLLAYSRVENQQASREPVDLEEVLDHVRANLREPIEEAGAQIEHRPLPTVQGNRTQLVQLFENLLSNAIKFRGDGAPTVSIQAEREGEMWRIQTEDDGIGIAPDYQDKVFTIFQRLHTSEQYQGTGIGLAICKRIVDHHGGQIGVDSELGEGATFWFTLPDASTDEPPAPEG